MKIVSILLIVFGLSCSHHQDEENTPNESNVGITKSLRGHRWGNIYFSAQPKIDDVNSLHQYGFKTVINLRNKNEPNHHEDFESLTLRKNGINYYNVPFANNGPLTDRYIDAVTSKVMQHRHNGKILIHCSSGNRVAIWLGGHFQKDHKFTKEKSLKLARQLGLNKAGAEKKLLEYLK